MFNQICIKGLSDMNFTADDAFCDISTEKSYVMDNVLEKNIHHSPR